MKRIVFILSCILVSYRVIGQDNNQSVQGTVEQIVEVKWYTIEEAEKLNKVKPKKFLIDVYTDWCGWCKKMDKGTFTNPVIAQMLNEYFYPVKFNAETSDTVTFNGAKYINLNRGNKSTHPLALSLLGWRMSYPSIVYLTEHLEYLGPMPGYKTPEQLEVILSFIAQNKFMTTSLEEYSKSFVGKIKPVSTQEQR